MMAPLPTRRVCSALVALAVLGAPSASQAHVGGGRDSSSFEARPTGFVPPVPGLTASVQGGDQRLRLQLAGREVVVVRGVLGEPFLRLSPAGVDVNLASPTATAAKVVPASAAVSGSRPVWQHRSGAHSVTWHEGRLRPVPVVSGSGRGARRIASWSIPLLVDGRPARLVGAEWYAPPPSLLPWLLAAALLVGGAGAAAWLLPRSALRRIATALLVVVLAALLAGWTGILLDGAGSPLALAVAAGYALVTALFALAAVTAASGSARLAIIGLLGLTAAAFSTPELGVFAHGFVLSLLPAGAARAAVVLALAGGVALAVVCAPAALETLRASPFPDEPEAPPGPAALRSATPRAWRNGRRAGFRFR